MHILLLHQAFAALDEPGGTRHYELARYLVEKGHRVTIIASPVSYLTGKVQSTPEPSAASSLSGLSILRVYTYPALHRSFVHRVFSFLSFMVSAFIAGMRVSQVDVVWGTSPPIFQAVAAWALARLKRTPFLLEVRDLWPDFAIAVGVLRNPLLVKLSRLLERFLYRHSDQVMVNSPGFISHVTAKGAPQCALVPNGADPRMFDPYLTGGAFRESKGLVGRFVALYAGAHGLSNDLDMLIDAAQFLQARSDIVLVLLGDGKEKPALLQRAARLGLPNLVFLPPVPKSGMAEVLASADACIAILKPIPLYATVYPNKVFDYMAAGRPVVLAVDGVIRQIIESVQAGIFAPPGDAGAIARAIRSLADDPAVGNSMGQRGRQYIETHFDRAVLADQFERLLQNLVHS